MPIVDRPQTLIKLQATNVKRLKAVEVCPDGSVVVVGGKNAQGKSSVLDSIMYGLRGKAIPGRPVRDGEDKASIVLETQDLTVHRDLDASGGSTLKVTMKGVDAQLNSPQNVLDHLTAGIAFDPLAFSRKRSKEQADELMKHVGLDFSDLEEEYKNLFQDRTLVNRQAKSEQARLDGMPCYPELEGVQVESLEDLMAELDAIRQHNRECEDVRAVVQEQQMAVDHDGGIVKGLKDRVSDLKAQLQEAQAALKDGTTRLKMEKDNLKRSKTSNNILKLMSDADVRAKIDGLEETNKKIRANEDRDTQADSAKKLSLESELLTSKLERCRAEKERRIRDAKMPIEGLGFGEGGVVTFNGHPLGQCSDSEKIRISVAIAVASNPRMPVMLIREGSLLDSDSRRLLAELAREAGAQVWIEVVTDEEPGAIIIEDGSVKGVA